MKKSRKWIISLKKSVKAPCCYYQTKQLFFMPQIRILQKLLEQKHFIFDFDSNV